MARSKKIFAIKMSSKMKTSSINKPIKKLGRLSLFKIEKQKRQSILASIKLDDGKGNQSESESSKRELKKVIKEIYSGFS